MTKLTSSQSTLLLAAIQSGNGSVPTAGVPKPTALSLTKRGLASLSDDASLLTVTDAGRAAIAPPVQEPPTPTDDPTASARSKPKGKTAILIELLGRPEGATVTQMTVAIGWQAHSVRGAMSGALKGARGLNVVSEKTADGRVYRIAAEAEA